MKQVAVMVGVVCVAGCGKSDLPELGDVSGVVTLDGDPLPNAVVSFQPTGARPSTGETDEDGRYELLYIIDEPGAIVGEHSVTIRPLITDAMDDYDPEDPDAGGEPPPVYPAAASDGSIKKTVEAGDNEINIDLVSDGS